MLGRRLSFAFLASILAHTVIIAITPPGPHYFGRGGQAKARPFLVKFRRSTLDNPPHTIYPPAIEKVPPPSAFLAPLPFGHQDKGQKQDDIETDGEDLAYQAGGSLLHPDPYVPADDLDSKPAFLTPPPDMLYGAAFLRSGKLLLLLRIGKTGGLDNIEVEYSDFDEQGMAEIIERLRVSRFSPGMLKGNAVPSKWRLVFDVSLGHGNYRILPANDEQSQPDGDPQ